MRARTSCPRGGSLRPRWKEPGRRAADARPRGAALRRARLRQGRTPRGVADRARVSLPYLSEIERGRKEPSSEVLAAVCRVLGLHLVDLVGALHTDLVSAATVTVSVTTRATATATATANWGGPRRGAGTGRRDGRAMGVLLLAAA